MQDAADGAGIKGALAMEQRAPQAAVPPCRAAQYAAQQRRGRHRALQPLRQLARLSHSRNLPDISV